MAEQHSKASGGSGQRRRRRRSSRKRGRTNKARSNDAVQAHPNRSGGDAKSGSAGRRRRRRRSRAQREQRREAVAQADMLDAKLPESIFVYTHVLRSSELDTYGFRPDPFLNHSRSLEDFRIDLSPLFPENAGMEESIFDSALHGPIVTSLSGEPETWDDSHEAEDDEGDGDWTDALDSDESPNGGAPSKGD